MKTLAKICLDATLLAQRAEGEALPDGYAFQRAVAQLLRMPGMRCVQAAGLTRLWGFESASGAPHELDAAARMTPEAYVIEAKAGGSVSKADLAVFELKLTDFYFGRWRELTNQRWHPILICAAPPGDSLRRLAAHRGVVLCDPERLALPVIYHHATHPTSTGALPDQLVSELKRLVPRALETLQDRYRGDPSEGVLRLRPDGYTADELDDLLFIQDELTDEVLARYDRLAPGRLERRGAELARALVRARQAA
jgi:hypothetical protein